MATIIRVFTLIMAVCLLPATGPFLRAQSVPADDTAGSPAQKSLGAAGELPAGESGSQAAGQGVDNAPPKASSNRPLVLPPKTRPKPAKRSANYWVDQLGHSQYLRRAEATRQLVKMGPEAVPAVVKVLRVGDLETIERAMTVITEVALNQPPSDDGGAWGILNDLAASSSGIRSARADAAIAEVRSARSRQARKMLAACGVFVGLDEFVVRSMSEPRTTVEIDEQWTGDVAPLEWLRWLDGIEFARVKGPAVRKDVLEHLVTVPDLQTVVIADAKVDEQTLEPLKSMPRISSLEFRYVPLTPELCDMIAALPIRLSLNLMGTGVALEKVEQMRAALPGLIIDHKQGGFLGVVCYDGRGVCQISRIVEDSAADDAGLIEGDVIVGIGDAEVSVFKDLQTAINQHLPGDEVVVKYVRGSQIESVKLRLRRLEER